MYINNKKEVIFIEIFSVFARIALRMEEFERKMQRAREIMEGFVRYCERLSEQASEAFNSVGDRVRTVIGYLAYFNIIGDSVRHLNRAVSTLKEKWGDAVSGLKGFADSISKASSKITSFATEAKELGVKVGNFLVDKLKLAGSKIQAFGAKAKIAAGKLWLLLGPKGLIILAITAVVGAVIGWIANNEEAQKKLLAIWNKIKDFMTPIIEFIGRLVSEVFGWIQSFIENHGETIRAVFDRVWSFIQRIIEGKLETIKSVFRIFSAVFNGDWQSAWDEVLAIGQRFMDRISAVLRGIMDIGRNLIEGLWNGIQSKAAWLADRITNFMNSGVLGTVMRLFGINSPSKVFADKVGKPIVMGLVKGIEDESDLAKNAIAAMTDKMLAPQEKMFHERFVEICQIVVKAMDEMGRKASVWHYMSESNNGHIVLCISMAKICQLTD
jgi:phage-related protein